MGEQFELIGKNRRTIKKIPGTRIRKMMILLKEES